MGFKNMPLKSIVLVSLAVIFLIGFMIMKFSAKEVVPVMDDNDALNPIQNPVVAPQMASTPMSVINDEEDPAIGQQLDRDRLQQKQTKDLRIKLEQTNLELEQEKVLAEINKIKKENMEAFNEPTGDGQNELPEIKVDYIGGGSVKKEAILSISGTNYQVKERSNPVSNIQVVSISDSNVTLHFSAPQNLTKTIDYRPE